jgi:hypothetical protein
LTERVEELEDDSSYILKQLTRLSEITADGAEIHYDVFSELKEQIDLLADKIGVSFEVVEEVPAIPEHLVLLSKTSKKGLKKVTKKVKSNKRK